LEDIEISEGEDVDQSKVIEEKSESQPRLETVKILSEEDWTKLRYIQEHKKELEHKGVLPNSKKRKIIDVEDDVNVDSIVGLQKKKRLSKPERLKVLQELQEEKANDKKRFKHGMKRVGGSSTNIEKRKFKPYSMVRLKALERQRKRSANKKLRIREKHIQKLASQKLDHH